MSAKKFFFIISSLIFPISSIYVTAMASKQTEIEKAIEDDIAWYAAQQNLPERYPIMSGIIDADSNSPWVTVIDRDGSDGGHLTVQADLSVVEEYTVYLGTQGGGMGDLADLEPNDVFIEWDEDPNHGSNHDFSFDGDYIEETPSYIQISGVNTTNWTAYRVLSNGTLIKTIDTFNELDAILFPGPLLFEKVDDIDNGDCVKPGDEITYTICYSYPIECNDLIHPNIRYVNIIDHLPDEVDYVSSWPPGDYNDTDHTVTWSIGTISPGDANCFTLTVEVKHPEPGSTITNFCELNGDSIYLTDYENTPVCIPTLTKDDNIADMNCPVPPDAEITYSICYAADGYVDTNVVITDFLPNKVDYISSDPCGAHNDSNNTVTWDIGTLGPNDSDCLELIVQINDNAKPGEPFGNCCEMTGDRLTSPLSAYEQTTMGVIYVDKDANGTNKGTSWQDAYNYLQDALDNLQQCSYSEIWVAEGNYMPDRNSANPDGTGDRADTFQLISGIVIKGGYAGYDANDPNNDPDERDIHKYETILSGDIDIEGDDSDNSYHVVTGSGTEPNAVLEGFTIKGGNAADWSSPQNDGGGMLNESGSPTVINCTFSDNSADDYGGGMYNYIGSPTVINCTFSGNSADDYGGGMYNSGNSLNITNCNFSGNSADYGGGMYNEGSSLTVTKCTFSGNSAHAGGYVGGGGGMYNEGSDPNIINCTFIGNSADNYGGGMYNGSSEPNIINCTFGGNSADNYGGGMYNVYSYSTITNCIFSENQAGAGGGMYNSSDEPIITNCLFNKNSAGTGGGICGGSPKVTNCTFNGNYATGNPPYSGGGIHGSPKVTNCILWSNSPDQIEGIALVAYSNIQGGWEGEGENNINADPCFVDVDSGNYRLSWNSPSIDAGNNREVPRDTFDIDGDVNTHERIPTDLDGLPRFIDSLFTADTGNCIPPFVDMGAYEFRIVLLNKVDVNEPNCAGPNDEITYIIDCNYPAGPNRPDIYDVNIIDYLPSEVNYISASDNGAYDSNYHTVTWNIGTLEPGDTSTVTLTVKVKGDAGPCSKISNCCMIKSGKVVLNATGPCEVPPSATSCEQLQDCGWVWPGDFNGDCHVNFEDLAKMFDDWLRCIEPTDANCEKPWLNGGPPELAVAYEVINIDLNGSASDPCYFGKGPVGNPDWAIIKHWNGYYLGEGELMPSTRCENIGVPGSAATYAKAVFIADPNVHRYLSGGPGDLLGDGFTKQGGQFDLNLFMWGNWAYGGLFDVYVMASAPGSFSIRDGKGTIHGPSNLTGVGDENNWAEGQNYVKFTDVWIGGTDTRDANGPKAEYLQNNEYLTDPNCAVLSYSNRINGIQLASVKRKVRMSGYYLPTPANDPCVVAIASPGALRRAVKGQWPVETPLAVIKLTGTSNRTNLLCGDYDAYYETNLRGGEYDKDGPDAMWATGDSPLKDYVDQDWVADGYMSYVDSGEWMEYDLIATTATKAFYTVRALVNCWWGAAKIGVYVDKSDELGEMEQQKYSAMTTPETDANAIYWTNDVKVMLLSGFHKLRLRQNGAYYNILGFQIAYDSTLVVNNCADVLKYGLGIEGDLNRDCYVNFCDFALLANDWAKCNDPCDPICTVQEP